MLGDPMRGVHYELTVALAPKATQLLFLSGSVANPHDVVVWLQRIGRNAVLIEHKTRPVPLEETDLGNLPDSQFVQSRSPSSPRPVFDRTGVYARNDKKELRAAHVGTGASIDLDGFAFFDEERHVNGFTGLEFRRLCHVAGGIAADAFG